jgi:hypothetical protein
MRKYPVQGLSAVEEHRVCLAAVHQQHLGVKLPVLLEGSLGVQHRVKLRGQAGHQLAPGNVPRAGTLVAQVN